MIVAGTLNLTIVKGCTFEALDLTMLGAGNIPVDITGYNVAAEVRASTGTTVILDLLPTITNAPGGVITLAAIDDETTGALPAGIYQWDLLLESGADDRQQILAGRFDIQTKITDS